MRKFLRVMQRSPTHSGAELLSADWSDSWKFLIPWGDLERLSKPVHSFTDSPGCEAIKNFRQRAKMPNLSEWQAEDGRQK